MKKIMCWSLVLLAVGLCTVFSITSVAAQEVKVVSSPGNTENLADQLSYPHSVVIDTAGNIYVADTGNNRVVKLDSTGRTTSTTFGTKGNGAGQFVMPADIALDNLGNIYIADTANDRIQKLDSNGRFLWQKAIKSPKGISVTKDGKFVYASATADQRIYKYNSNGDLVLAWGEQGSGNGTFYYPHDVAVDDSGNVYVTDFANHLIQKFNSNGEFLTQWGGLGDTPGKFNNPSGVAVDGAGRVWVSDMSNHRIQVFNADGGFIKTFGHFSKSYVDADSFNHPKGLAMVGNNRLVVAQPGFNAVFIYDVSNLTLEDSNKTIINGRKGGQNEKK